MVLVTNGRLITRDSEGKGYYEHGAVAYEGAKIVEVGEEAALRAKYADAEIVDAKGGVIMPAFINAHTHIYSALARGLSIVGNNPTNFYEVLDGTWWAIDRHLMMDGTRASATALYIDSIKQGVTTIFDHHASYGEIPGTLHTIAEESKRLGLRSCLCYEVSDRDGEEKCLQAIAENADFITECEKNKDPMLAAMFGGHALFTISDKTFDRMVEANNGRTGYHIHVSEGMNDVYDSLQNYGRRPVQRLQDHGILGEKTILGHCIHVNTAEIELIKNTDTMVVNNPESNMGNAVGILVGQLLGAGKMEEAVDTDRKLITFSVVICIVLGGLMSLVAHLFPQIYNTSDSIRDLAASFIRICALCMPINALANACYFTLRSGGKTFVTFLFDSFYVCVLTVPMAFVLSRFTGLPIVPLFLCCQLADIGKCVVGLIMIRRGVWIQNIVGKEAA